MTTQAVAEPAPAPETPEVHALPPMTPIGEVWNKAIAEAKGDKAPEPAAVEPQKASEAKKPVKAAEPETKEAVKPVNALDAVLETKAEEKAEPEVVDPLKDFPEEPQEGVKRNWKGLRGVAENALETARTERTEKERLAKELEVAQTAAKQVDPQIQAERDKLKAENAELRDAITGVNLELLPEFRKEFIEGRKELVNAATEKVAAYGGDAEALKAALGMNEGIARDNAIEAAFGDEMTEVRKTNIRNMVSQIEAKDEARAKQMYDPQNSFEAYQAKDAARKQKQNEESQVLRQSTIKDAVKGLTETSPLFRPAPDGTAGKEEWDKGLPELNEAVSKALSPDMTIKEVAVIAAKGHRYDFVETKLKETYSELVAAKKQLAEFDTAQPDLKGQKQPQLSSEEAKLEKTPGQIFVEELGKGRDINL